jgi:hypothetical protein
LVLLQVDQVVLYAAGLSCSKAPEQQHSMTAVLLLSLVS